MEYGDAYQVMLIIALATPAVALCGWLVLRGQDTSRSDWARFRRNLLILALAGPLNLALWWILNRWLDQVGYRSIFGYAAATLVFIVAGFVTGFFSRVLRRKPRRPATPES